MSLSLPVPLDFPPASVQGAKLGERLVERLHAAVSGSRSWAVSPSFSSMYHPNASLALNKTNVKGVQDIAVLLMDRNLFGAQYDVESKQVSYIPTIINALVSGTVKRTDGCLARFMQAVRFRCVQRIWAVEMECLLFVEQCHDCLPVSTNTTDFAPTEQKDNANGNALPTADGAGLELMLKENDNSIISTTVEQETNSNKEKVPRVRFALPAEDEVFDGALDVASGNEESECSIVHEPNSKSTIASAVETVSTKGNLPVRTNIRTPDKDEIEDIAREETPWDVSGEKENDCPTFHFNVL